MAENEMRITFQNIRLQTGSSDMSGVRKFASFGCQEVLLLFMLSTSRYKSPS